MIRFTTLGTRPFDGGIIQVVGSDGGPSFGTIIIFIVTMCILGIGPIITIQAETGFIGSIAITLSTIENSRVLLHKTDKMVFMKNRTKEIYRYGNPWQADEWANYLPESLGMKPSHSLSKII